MTVIKVAPRSICSGGGGGSVEAIYESELICASIRAVLA